MRTVAFIVLPVLALVALLCVLDVRCSIEKDRGRATELNRVRGELAAGAQADRQRLAEGIELQIRMLRARARKLNEDGDSEEARRVTAEVIRLTGELERVRGKR